MVSYVAVPPRLIGAEKRKQSTRDKLSISVVGGALSVTVCTPPYLLEKAGDPDARIQSLVHPRDLRARLGVTLQAGATGAVTATKMSATLATSRRSGGSSGALEKRSPAYLAVRGLAPEALVRAPPLRHLPMPCGEHVRARESGGMEYNTQQQFKRPATEPGARGSLRPIRWSTCRRSHRGDPPRERRRTARLVTGEASLLTFTGVPCWPATDSQSRNSGHENHFLKVPSGWHLRSADRDRGLFGRTP